MSPIQAAYINALLADSSYAVGVGVGAVDPSRFEDRLTGTQANYLAANFEVISSIESPKPLGMGFDAVVWRGKAGTPYDGQTFVSMRGTQGVQDLADDVGLAASGVPISQIVDMVNWWMRIKTPLGQPAQQIGYATESGYILVASTPGTGELAGTATITSVNGHSLGGYLATAFTRIFGNQAGVPSVNTFNSAGFSNAAAVNIEAEYSNIGSLLGGGMGVPFAVLGGKQTNYYGENGIEVARMRSHNVRHKKPRRLQAKTASNPCEGLMDCYEKCSSLTRLLAPTDVQVRPEGAT